MTSLTRAASEVRLSTPRLERLRGATTSTPSPLVSKRGIEGLAVQHCHIGSRLPAVVPGLGPIEGAEPLSQSPQEHDAPVAEGLQCPHRRLTTSR
jgi:hypothetical protein